MITDVNNGQPGAGCPVGALSLDVHIAAGRVASHHARLDRVHRVGCIHHGQGEMVLVAEIGEGSLDCELHPGKARRGEGQRRERVGDVDDPEARIGRGEGEVARPADAIDEYLVPRVPAFRSWKKGRLDRVGGIAHIKETQSVIAARNRSEPVAHVDVEYQVHARERAELDRRARVRDVDDEEAIRSHGEVAVAGRHGQETDAERPHLDGVLGIRHVDDAGAAHQADVDRRGDPRHPPGPTPKGNRIGKGQRSNDGRLRGVGNVDDAQSALRQDVDEVAGRDDPENVNRKSE